ncbi:unnamed protein product, partial [Prorocentrum cordatum]
MQPPHINSPHDAASQRRPSRRPAAPCDRPVDVDSADGHAGLRRPRRRLRSASGHGPRGRGRRAHARLGALLGRLAVGGRHRSPDASAGERRNADASTCARRSADASAGDRAGADSAADIVRRPVWARGHAVQQPRRDRGLPRREVSAFWRARVQCLRPGVLPLLRGR